MVSRLVLLFVFIAAMGLPRRAHAQVGCDALPPSSDFTVELISVADGWPFDIVVDRDLKVYWVERFGAFKVYDPGTKGVTLIKQFDVMATNFGGFFGDVESGLEGLAFDVHFADNHWIYMWYATANGAMSPHKIGPSYKLSRFTLIANNTQVDAASEKIILEMPIFAQCCHFGGDLRMGRDGLLYLSTGDNVHYSYTGTGEARAYDPSNDYSDPRNTSSNTNDLRGKILRIKPIPFPDSDHPAPGVGTTYTIPAGNLKDTWATAEKDKVRPEIYTMGHRNPFSMGVHPEKPWLVVGEAGGDNPGDGDDEINVVTKPGNFGWPFLNGDNQSYIPEFWDSEGYDPSAHAAALTNSSTFNTGAHTLPPAVGSAISVRHGAMAMPMTCHGVTWGWVDYDSTSSSKSKWPPYLKGKVIVSGYSNANVNVATVDSAGNVTKVQTLFNTAFGGNNMNFNWDVLRATQGPDGAFYVGRGHGITFSKDGACRIFKVSYKGPCSKIAGINRARMEKLVAKEYAVVHLGETEIDLAPGIRRVEAFDVKGGKVWEARRSTASGDAKEIIPAGVARGMLQLRYFAD
jgi:cytochrome c